MSQPSSSSPKALLVPLAVAALLGGGVAAAITALVDDGDQQTTTVVRQPALVASTAAQGSLSSGLTAADIYHDFAPGVVYVRAEIVSQTDNPFDLGTQRSQATGSGFVIDDSGDILTNNHVIDGASKDSVTVQFADHRTYSAKVVGTDPSTDVALLKVSAKGLALRPLPLGSSKGIRVGDPTIAIGNPFGLDRTLTTGVVSALQREIRAPNGFPIRNVIQTDASINPGNSGGPLIDASGRVIGINSQIETGGVGTGSVGIGFAVPIDTVKSVLDDLKRGHEVQRAFLGATTLTIDGSLKSLDLPTRHGVLVQAVTPGGPAAKAGIRAGTIQLDTGAGDPLVVGGDIVTRFDGRPIRASDKLAQLVAAHKPGDKAEVELVRQGEVTTVEVTLGKRPSQLQAG
jgi:S1-C subfamily serine protease